MWNIIFIALASSLLINLVLFLVAFRLQSDKLTDVSYALSFLVIAIASLLYANDYHVFNWIIFSMVVLWAARIGGFLLIRVLIVGKDHRFDKMRGSFVRFGKFWLGQAITAWVLMLPVSMALYNGGNVSVGLLIGFGIWLVGLLIEAVADYQKLIFKLNAYNRNKWIQEGIWTYARHPNYFGEILVWLGIYVACFAALSPLERLVGLSSPVLISLLLLFVSGVPLLEKAADERWGTQTSYQKYKSRTRLVIPLPK